MMTKKTTQPVKDPFSGIFASVVLALVTSNFLANLIEDKIGIYFSFLGNAFWQTNLVAGLFVGIVLADPIGVLTDKRQVSYALARLAIGFLSGILLQTFLITPIAGDGMSMYLFLMLFTMLVPLYLAANWAQNALEERGILLSEKVSVVVLRVLSLPDRAVIVLTMALSFGFFWVFSETFATTFVTMAIILAATTFYVAFTRVEMIDDNPWYEVEPPDDVDMTSSQMATARFVELSKTLLPGALLLGGVTQLTARILQQIYPAMDIGTLADPVSAVMAICTIAASGLGVVLFGMVAALGCGLGFLLMIGRATRRSPDHIREGCWRLVRVLCFRPLRKSDQI